jgi:hypothetical protein
MSDKIKDSTQSLTSTVKKHLNNFLTTSENNIESRINSRVNSEKSTKCLKDFLSRISELHSTCELLVDWLKDARDEKRLIDRHQALFNALDLAQEIQYQLKNLGPSSIKYNDEKAIRSSLSRYLDTESIETLIELKNTGQI